MKKGRLEAFSDGVVAIIITIMVLELHVPIGDSLEHLRGVLPAFMSYVLSFVYVGIYWNNHHHLIYSVEKINGSILWANLNLLFWLSLVPFVTAWMGQNHFTKWPVALYGFDLIMNALSYTILSNLLIRQAGAHSTLAVATGRDTKGKISLLIYAVGIVLAFFLSWVSVILYAVVAIIWFIPDRRIESRVDAGQG